MLESSDCHRTRIRSALYSSATIYDMSSKPLAMVVELEIKEEFVDEFLKVSINITTVTRMTIQTEKLY